MNMKYLFYILSNGKYSFISIETNKGMNKLVTDNFVVDESNVASARHLGDYASFFCHLLSVYSDSARVKKEFKRPA